MYLARCRRMIIVMNYLLSSVVVWFNGNALVQSTQLLCDRQGYYWNDWPPCGWVLHHSM